MYKLFPYLFYFLKSYKCSSLLRLKWIRNYIPLVYLSRASQTENGFNKCFNKSLNIFYY